MELKEFFGRLLEKREMNPNSLAVDIGHPTAQSKFARIKEGDTKRPRRDHILELAAKKLKVNVLAFFDEAVADLEWARINGGTTGAEQARDFDANVTQATVGTGRVPVISYVQAGTWTEATDPYAMGSGWDYLTTDLDLSRSAFALEINGDSMQPDFKPGDKIIVDPEVSPQPGDFVVAKNSEEEATFKKYRQRGVDERGNVVFELVPLNPDYETLRSDQEPIRIVGTMVEHRKYRKR